MERNPQFKDFRNFLYACWKHLNLPDPTPAQYDIALYLQHGPRRAIIEAFRGVGKSWITSVFVLWLLYWNPALNILVVSASKSRADDFSTFTLRLINEVPFLQHLKPRGDQRNSKIAFDVGPAPASHSPSVKSVGVTGMMSGSRADYIIADDVEVPNNSMTQMMRTKLAEAVKEFDAILKPDGRVLYLGTPQCEMSLYNVLRTRGYAMRIWPARYPSMKRVERDHGLIAPRLLQDLEDDPGLAGEPADAVRFPEDDLLEREASYGRSGFALQFMLDTALADADRYPLKLSDLIVMALDKTFGPQKVVWGGGVTQNRAVQHLPCVGLDGDRWHAPMWCSGQGDDAQDEPRKYTGVIMAIDPSGRGKDEATYSVMAMLHGNLFLLDMGGYLSGYDDKTLIAFCETAQKYAVTRLVIESNFGDGMFEQLLKPHLKRIYPCTIEEVRHNTNKEKRIIDTLEPVFNQHRFIVDEKLINKDFNIYPDRPAEERQAYQLFYQLTRMTNTRGALMHDDRLDVVSIAVAHWLRSMSVDPDVAVKSAEEAWLDQQVQDFIDHANGITGEGSCSWV